MQKFMNDKMVFHYIIIVVLIFAYFLLETCFLISNKTQALASLNPCLPAGRFDFTDSCIVAFEYLFGNLGALQLEFLDLHAFLHSRIHALIQYFLG